MNFKFQILVGLICFSLVSASFAEKTQSENRASLEMIVESFLRHSTNGDLDLVNPLLLSMGQLRELSFYQKLSETEKKEIEKVSESISDFHHHLRTIQDGTAFGDKIKVLEIRFHSVKYRDSYTPFDDLTIDRVEFYTLFRYIHEEVERQTDNRSTVHLLKNIDGDYKIFGIK